MIRMDDEDLGKEKLGALIILLYVLLSSLSACIRVLRRYSDVKYLRHAPWVVFLLFGSASKDVL
jgi:hypothetical protein